MRLDFGHGSRLHLSFFSPRCRWTCLRQGADSDTGSDSTTTSILDTVNTASWTYVSHRQPIETSDRASSLDDVDLISLINGDMTVRDNNMNAASSEDDVSQTMQSWLHSRPDLSHVTEARVESEAGPSSSVRWSTFSGGEEYCYNGSLGDSFRRNGACEGISRVLAAHNSRDSTWLDARLDRDVGTLDRFPTFDRVNENEGAGDDTSDDQTNEYLTLEFLDRVLRTFELQCQGTDSYRPSGWHWQDWYDRPHSRFQSRPMALPLFDARSQHPSFTEPDEDISVLTRGQRVNDYPGPHSTLSSQGSHNTRDSEHSLDEDISSPGDETLPWPDRDNTGNSESTPSRPSLTGLFTNRSIYLPPSHADVRPPSNTPPPSNAPPPLPPINPSSSNHSSLRSSGSRGNRMSRQQNWYFYDPRLVGGRRTERITLDTSFRGQQNRCFMSNIIQPPSYEELMETDGTLWELPADVDTTLEPPPPYRPTEGEPPPTYDQSFEHMLLYDAGPIPEHNHIGLYLNHTLVSSQNSQHTDSDLLTGVNIDELLGTTPQDDVTITSPEESSQTPGSDDPSGASSTVTSPSQPEGGGASASLQHQGAVSTPRRYPVGFRLGRRPPVRWSRGIPPDRWASRQDWVLGAPALT